MSISQRKDGRWLVKYKINGKWMQKAFHDEGTARAFDAEQIEPEQDTRLSLMELKADNATRQHGAFLCPFPNVKMFLDCLLGYACIQCLPGVPDMSRPQG